MRIAYRIVIAAVALSIGIPCGSLLAEDTKGKWQFGFGLSYYATEDNVRSNSDIAIGDTVVDDNGIPSVGSVDERPDDSMLNQPTIQDSFQLDVHGSYGISRWLAIQLAASYLTAPVGKIEFYTNDATQPPNGETDSSLSACGPNMDQNCWYFSSAGTPATVKNTDFVSIGTVKELPMHLSALVRFRPESPLDPYIGLGLGYRKVDVATNEDFNTHSQRVGSLVVAVACEGEYTGQTCEGTEDTNKNGILDLAEDTNMNGILDSGEDTNMNGILDAGEDRDPDGTSGPLLPNGKLDAGTGLKSGPFFPKPLTVDVQSGLEWFAQGGVDYYVNEKFSFYVDAKYVWNTSTVDIRVDDAHQVRFGVTDPGRLLLACVGGNEFCNGPSQDQGQWKLWEDEMDLPGKDIHTLCSIANGSDRNCKGDGLLETEDIVFNQNLDLNAGLEHINEDSGILYGLLPGQGPLDYGEAIQVPCPACVNGKLDTEDANGNGTFDRYLLYGYDVCTTQAGAGNPLCNGVTWTPDTPVHSVWPGGCAQSPDPTANANSVHENGCPAFPVQSGGGTPSTLGSTAVDDPPDVYLIQGGAVKLGGFALGIGFKFTF